MRLLINARNRSVAVEQGRIVAEGGKYDAVIDASDAEVRPGLINAHDHLHRNHYGRLGSPPYPNADRWAADIQARHRRRIADRRRMPRRQALLAGAWKNLFAGVTTVVHHDRWEAEFERDFPLRVAPIATADSVQDADIERLRDQPRYCVHVAEGTDRAAADEVRQLDARGLLDRRMIAVHAVGIDDDGVDLLTRRGAALGWCPTSNHFLLGKSAPAALLDSGIDVLLGSDSLLSGAGNLLDELRFARRQRALPDALLEQAVAGIAARRLGAAEPNLEVGAAADLILLRKPLLEARASDVALVVAAGIPRVADPQFGPRLDAAGLPGAPMTVASVTRWTHAASAIEPPGRLQ